MRNLPRRILARSLTVAVVHLLALGLAHAQDPAVPAEPPVPPVAAPVPPGEPPPSPPGDTSGSDADTAPVKKKKKKKDLGDEGIDSQAQVEAAGAKIELRGRVMTNAILEHQRVPGAAVPQVDRDTLNLEVSSARFGLKVEVLEWVSLVIEAELAGRVRLRDGFVQARRKHWSLRAGQFKMPISVFTLESPWNLPLARRGVLNDLLSDHLLLSGRRAGYQAQLAGGGSLDPALTLGAFHSVQWGTDAGDPIPNPDIDDQTLVARLSITPKGIEVAAVGLRRVTVVNQPRAYWAAGLESTGDIEFERTGVRFWAETNAGTSWLGYDPNSTASVNFFTARLLGAFRFGGLSRGQPFFEPFATFGILEPDTDSIDDLYWEAMAGVNMGHWRYTRVTLQFEMARSARNFPTVQYFSAFGLEPLYRHQAVLLMVGAAF
jgi:hypothetical protein